MSSDREHPEFRIEKTRRPATLTLANGDSVFGWFFVSAANATSTGPERIGDLLNDGDGFFPFALEADTRARTALYHRAHIVTVTLEENEARLAAGYELATRRTVSLLLTNGERLTGTVRVYQAEGRDRVSDWARNGRRFRYVETADATTIVNIGHVIEVSEEPE